MESVLCVGCKEPIPFDKPARPVRWHARIRRRVHRVSGFACANCPPTGVVRDESGYSSSWAPSGQGPDLPPTPCENCGRSVILAEDKRRRRTTCSSRCAVALTPSHQKPPPENRSCAGCAAELSGRTDRAYCSPACRQRAYRARVHA